MRQFLPIRLIYNATRHNHYAYRYEWENIKCEFVPSYASRSLPVELTMTAVQVKELALRIVEDAVKYKADTILVSGLTSLMMFVSFFAVQNKLNVIEPVFSGRDRNVLTFSHYRDLTNEIIHSIEFLKQSGD